MTTQNSAGPENPGTGAANLHRVTQPSEQRTAEPELPVVFGTKMLAAGTASLDWVLVKICCWCGYAHKHLMFEVNAQTIERSPSCAPHRVYQVRIADSVPARREGRAA